MIELLNWFATRNHFIGLIVIMYLLGYLLTAIIEAARKRPD